LEPYSQPSEEEPTGFTEIKKYNKQKQSDPIIDILRNIYVNVNSMPPMDQNVLKEMAYQMIKLHQKSPWFS